MPPTRNSGDIYHGRSKSEPQIKVRVYQRHRGMSRMLILSDEEALELVEILAAQVANVVRLKNSNPNPTR